MAGWKVHVAGGVVFSILTVIFFLYFGLYSVSWQTLLVIAPIVFLYAQFPDVDHENSRITHLLLYFFVIVNAGIVFLVWYKKLDFNAIIFSAIILVALMQMIRLPHRGMTHTLTSGVILSLPLLFAFNWIVVLVAFMSYMSHLFLDCGKGKPFYPLRLWGAWK